ncbi:dTDP-4-dehydrorhamnose reductase [Azospirillum rugosum]|uniref:dTDP-4-dehydrorhamnose reductase n=1 Tax=Azospirillum rugosum TaxID=416170 RepID=A0ABS4SP99_9PROT|nr:dTDP-4-dehydrorhamnose reductase [Azospirillum rugosum]MBP2294386.1 dTDP-4-dehydrorhamnose reductase [Azospirillum rugosum]MDQ0527721.1 dTDP-4-dehydrorhamnose reductase [Azospirillum rugosum]
MKILVLGTSGQVGTELMRAAWPPGTELVGLARPDVDMARPETVDAAVAAHAPDLVVNATAYTAVDKAESDRDAAFAVNRDGPARLAAACAARGVPLVHISTDYVFDGTKPAPYTEDDPVAPLGAYGASKEAGEAAVRAACPCHVILRTSWVYAAHGANFVKTMLRFGREREEMRVVADQHGAPTAASDIAAAIVAIAGRIAAAKDPGRDVPWGTYHFTGTGETTWHGFAERVFQRLEAATGRRPRLLAITTAEYPTPARRPANSRLDCARIRTAFGIEAPRWEDSLDRVLDELLSSPAS